MKFNTSVKLFTMWLIVGIILTIAITMSGCKFVQLNTNSAEGGPAQPCYDQAQYPDSQILKSLDDPCKIYDLLATIPTMGIALDNYTYDDLHAKIVSWVSTMRVSTSLSAKSVKDVIMMELLRVNKRAGIIVFVLSDAMLKFSDDVVFESDDIELIILALESIDRRCKLMNMGQ